MDCTKNRTTCRALLAGALLAGLAACGVLAGVTEIQIENPGVGYQADHLGESIAVDADTMIVGAPWTDTSAGTSAGSVQVYARDASGEWALQAALTAPDGGANNFFGRGVAVSGNTAMVGAYGHNGGRGAVYVFTRSGSSWTLQAKLAASDRDEYDAFGWSVSISGDIAVVGAYGDDDGGSFSGSSYIFSRSGGVWTQQSKLTASDAADGDHFGWSVSISGETAVVGAPLHNTAGSDAGAAYVFVRSGSAWSQQAILTASDASTEDNFGGSVSISGDTAVVGAHLEDEEGDSAGAAYVFTRSGSAWSEQAKLMALDGAPNDQFGHSVSISGDTVIVGADNDDTYTGSAHVFLRSGSAWSEQAKLTASDAALYDHFGIAVSVAGETVAVGSHCDDDAGPNAGSAYVFTRSAAVWTEQAKVLSSPAALVEFGGAVAISGDTAVIGAPGFGFPPAVNNSTCGFVHVFTRSGTDWIHQATLHASDAGLGDHFGCSVGISGDTLIVGASGDDNNGEDSGSAYIFTRTGSTWIQGERIGSGTAAGDQYGASVAISGDRAIVGAPGGSGYAYAYSRIGGIWWNEGQLSYGTGGLFGVSVSISGDTAVVGARALSRAIVFTRSFSPYGWAAWGQERILASPSPSSWGVDFFGQSVAIAGDTVVVGSPLDSGRGAAYVVKLNTGFPQVRLTASDAATGDSFGASVAIADDTIVVGAFWDDDGGGDSGAAYIFTPSGYGSWSERAKITASDAAAGDWFGVRVAIDGGRTLIGAPYRDAPEPDSGIAYIHELGAVPVTLSTFSAD